MPSIEQVIGIEQARFAKTVKIGALYCDASNIEKVLVRYCKHLFANNDSDEFPHSFPGSGSAIRLGDRHFLFCCGHQVAGFTPDQIALHPYKSKKTITASHMLLPLKTPENSENDYLDTRAFEFVVDNYDYPNLTSEFFKTIDEEVWPDNTLNVFIVLGFPTDRQSIRYEPSEVTAVMSTFTARYDGGTNSPFLHRIKLADRIASDGMSGGPVFHIGRNNGELFIGWAGMTMRGGKGSEYLHFLAADYLIEMALHHPIQRIDESNVEARLEETNDNQ